MRKIFHVNEEVDYKEVTEVVSVKDGDYLLLIPGELVHGITKEKLKLPDDIRHLRVQHSNVVPTTKLVPLYFALLLFLFLCFC